MTDEAHPASVEQPSLRSVSLSDLLARVERATEESIDLFIAVAVNIYPEAYPGGWVEPREVADWRFLRFERFLGAGAYIDAALALVERAAAPDVIGTAGLMRAKGQRKGFATLTLVGDGSPSFAGQAATPALALLSALLRSLIAETDQRDGSIPPGSAQRTSQDPLLHSLGEGGVCAAASPSGSKENCPADVAPSAGER